MAALKRIKDFKQPTPTNKERPFEYHELFFSITDKKSHITFANDVFIRISGYEEEELIGVLHKLIRHPDMPRAVFNIFWNFLLNDKPVAAYVKNLAKDGSYYWVMALAFPCEEGYLSIRLKPGSVMFTTVQALYDQTLLYEKQQEKKTDKKTAMQQAEEFLLQKIDDLGFESYESFMWSALEAEMKNRQNHLDKNEFRSTYQNSTIPKQMLELNDLLYKLFKHLDNLKSLQTTLNENSGFILELARTIFLLSINAQIGSSRLDQDDISLSVVAQKMGEQAVKGEDFLEHMQVTISQLQDLLNRLSFDIISSKLMTETTNYYANEVYSSDTNSYSFSELSPQDIVSLLQDSFLPYVTKTNHSLKQVPSYLNELDHDVQDIERFLKVLRFVHNTGKIEIARLKKSANGFSTTFKELLKEIDSAQKRVESLANHILESKSHNKFYAASNRSLKQITEQLGNEAIIKNAVTT
ncbi:PAS domain-containing protein [Fodinibius saliphilus]|uniref:PAS domain-containing protein n=1 Tax=Fodinibius saliphilus TaxID=1920650 RepID=UPI00110934A8|nr:PAS domain-containing protein [Fodinibius saliphilus]